MLAIVRGASRPLCAEEIVAAHIRRGWDGTVPSLYRDSRIRTALKQLRDAGAIVQHGETKTESGRWAQTWVAVDADDAAIARWLADARERRLARVAQRRHTAAADHAPTRDGSAAA